MQRSRRFGEYWEMLPQVLRSFDCAERGERSDFDRSAGLWPDSAQLGDAAQVEHVLRLKKFLPHRWNQVSATGEHADITCMFREEGNGFVYGARPEQSKLWKAQSAPPAGAERLAASRIERMPLRSFALEAK